MVIESILGLLLTLPPDPALKCPRTHSLPGYAEDDVALVLDGELHRTSVSENVISDIEPSEIERVEITCWDPDADEIPARRGIQLIVVVTKEGLADAQSAMLEALKTVRSYVASRAELPSSIEELDPTLLGYAIEIRDGAWTLTSAAHQGHICTAHEVDVAQARVRCDDILTPAGSAVREAWAAR